MKMKNCSCVLPNFASVVCMPVRLYLMSLGVLVWSECGKIVRSICTYSSELHLLPPIFLRTRSYVFLDHVLPTSTRTYFVNDPLCPGPWLIFLLYVTFSIQCHYHRRLCTVGNKNVWKKYFQAFHPISISLNGMFWDTMRYQHRLRLGLTIFTSFAQNFPFTH